MTRPHLSCWDGKKEMYQHICQELSGKACIDCGAPAGTRWTPFWCPDCDVVRQVRISEGFDQLIAGLRKGKEEVSNG